MPWMIADTELVSDELSYSATGPDSAAKAKGFSTLHQQVNEMCKLGRVEQGSGTGRWVGTQRIYSSMVSACKPLADSTLCDTQGLGDVGLLPSHLMQFPGTEAAALVPANGLFGITCAHNLLLSTFRPTIITSHCADQ